jgi:hypothetical protein
MFNPLSFSFIFANYNKHVQCSFYSSPPCGTALNHTCTIPEHNNKNNLLKSKRVHKALFHEAHTTARCHVSCNKSRVIANTAAELLLVYAQKKEL